MSNPWLETAIKKIMDIINNPGSTRDTVVVSYRELIQFDASSGLKHWKQINRAIVGRWSEHALEYIKRKAWLAS